MIELNLRQVAALSTEDEWTLALRDEFKLAFSEAGGELVYDKEAAKGETDFAPFALAIKSCVQNH